MRLNTANRFTEKTHEGAPAARMTPGQALKRSVCACLLWENTFYEDGESIADRILSLCKQVPVEFIAELAVHVRKDLNIRHAPLLLLLGLIENGKGRIISEAINAVISRPDELTELLALYWNKGKRDPVSKDKKRIDNQLKKGLAKAFTKFDAYQLAKYNRDDAIKLRDVMFLTHPKPIDDKMEEVYKSLGSGTLAAPDTWEVALSAGADKKETFERLIKEGNLGYLALLRNLRGMVDAKVDGKLIENAIEARKGADRVLPFRFVAAARAAPSLEPVLDRALLASLQKRDPLSGLTFVLVDVSGSMDYPLSAKSDLRRIDAAATLASIIPGKHRVFTFSERVVEVPARMGMAGIDAVVKSQAHSGTRLGLAIEHINKFDYDRLIVITDEQTTDRVGSPKGKHNYLINVGTYQNGVGYGNNWVHISGFSESVIKYIQAYED